MQKMNVETNAVYSERKVLLTLCDSFSSLIFLWSPDLRIGGTVCVCIFPEASVKENSAGEVYWGCSPETCKFLPANEKVVSSPALSSFPRTSGINLVTVSIRTSEGSSPPVST